jgi:hypothetical protein
MQRLTDDDFDENGILKDGHSYRVPLMMRDSAGGSARLHDGRGNAVGHKPGYILSDATNDARQQARDAYEHDLTTAWRGSDGEGTKPAKDGLPTMDARTSAYAQYDRELSEQWKGAGR